MNIALKRVARDSRSPDIDLWNARSQTCFGLFLLLPRFSGQRKQNSQASPTHSDLLFSYARNHTTTVMHTRVRCLVHFCDETHEMVRGWIEKHEAPLCLQTHPPLHSSTKSVRSLLNVCGRPYEHENRMWKCCLQRLDRKVYMYC